jgi:hypothetical protein
MTHTQDDRPSNTPTPILRLTVPFLIVVVSFVAYLGFQTSQLLQQRALIATAHSNQDTPIAEANKVRHQLDSIAGKTAALATRGNASAKLVIDDLSRQGIRISPPK